MHDNTKGIPAATEAFWKEAPFQGPPAEAFLWNRLAPYLEALWASAQAGDWNGFVDGAYQVYLAGLLDAGLPLAALLVVDEEGEMTSEAKVIRLKSLHTPAGSLPVAWVEVAERKDLAVPLARLAEVVEYDLKALRSLVERDPVLRDFQRVVTTLSGNLKRTQTYLLRPGVLGALVKISTSRIQDPAKRERIIAFQRWAFEALDRLLFEEFAPAPAPKAHAALQPLFPSAPAKFKGDRATAAAMLKGEVRRRDGSLYSYREIARVTAVPETTLRRMADRLGVRHLRYAGALPAPAKTPDAELLRLLRLQAELLDKLYQRLTPQTP